MSDDLAGILSADEYAALAAKPLHSAAEFHLYTGININKVRAGMRMGRFPVDPDNAQFIIVALAMARINADAIDHAKRLAATNG